MSQRSVLVVGAGVTGLCTAIFLARQGIPVEIWEASELPGGLLCPVPFAGTPCDLGSHRVHGDALPLLQAAAPSLPWAQRPRHGRLIFSDDGRDAQLAPRTPPFDQRPAAGWQARPRHVPYPLQLQGFLQGLGPRLSARFGVSFLRREASLRKFLRWEADRAVKAAHADDEHHDPGFEHFVRERVGHAAYEAFYQPYVEKVWGLPAQAISKTVAKKRVSTAQPMAVLRGALRATLKRHHDPAATFLYPPQGIGSLIDALCAEATTLGVRLHLGRRFDASAVDPPQRVVYTGHVGDLLPEDAADCFGHRGLYLIFLAFPTQTMGSVDTYYAPGRSLWFGRVSVPNHFAPGLIRGTQTLLCVEIPEGTWGSGQDFTQPDYLAELLRQLQWAGILTQPSLQPSAVAQRFLPRVYPLYQRGWLAHWRRELHGLARRSSVFPAGRQGLFLHCNIDHCVQIAKDVSQHLLRDGSSLDWIARCDAYLDVRVRD